MGTGNVALGVGQGAIAGAGTGCMIGTAVPGIGNVVGIVVGAIVGAIVGGVGTEIQEEKAAEVKNEQDQAQAKQDEQTKTAANRQARQMFEQAQQNRGASSDAVFTRTAMARKAKTGNDAIVDSGHPYTDDKVKAQRPVISRTPNYNYGDVEKA